MASRSMALGGLLVALTLILLYLTLLIPTNTLTLLTLASFMVPIALMRSNVRTGTLVYVTSSILSFLFLPLQISLLYVLFFGCYGIVKYYIERLDCLPKEWFFKLIFFNILFFVGFKLILALVAPNALAGFKALVTTYLPSYPNAYYLFFFLAGQVGFVVYDYAMTMLVDLYYKYFQH